MARPDKCPEVAILCLKLKILNGKFETLWKTNIEQNHNFTIEYLKFLALSNQF